MGTTDKVANGWAGKGYIPNMWTKYKLTTDGFDKLWSAQEGKCAGCVVELAHPWRKSFELAARPEIDHCHKTLVVRGLLCHQCNMLLGKIKDSKERLLRLEAYLQRNGAW